MSIAYQHFAEAVALAAPGKPFILDPENYDGLRMLDGSPKPSLAEIEAAWAARPAPAKTWPDAQAFTEEFSLAERGEIARSQDKQVGALWLTLSTWRTGINASHPLIIQGRAALIAAGIISEQRAAEIFDNP